MRLYESFKSIKSWIMFNKRTCLSQATPWRSRSYVTHSAQLTWNLSMRMKWCKYIPRRARTTVQNNENRCSRKREYSLLLRPLINVIGWRKATSEARASPRKFTFSTHTRMGVEDKSRKKRSIRARKKRTCSSHEGNSYFRQESVNSQGTFRKKGEFPCQTKW